MTTRGPKRKVVAADVETKRGKMDLMVQPKVEVVDKVEENHSCPICNLKLQCAPGDMVMKRHYMEKHYTSGGLLEMVALDLGEGEKLRCPYPDCEVKTTKLFANVVPWKYLIVKVGNKPMKLLLLNIHLERNHNRLKRLVELDGRPGINLF